MKKEIIEFTRLGMAIRYNASEWIPGEKFTTMKTAKGDSRVSRFVITKDVTKVFFLITHNGFGKRVLIKELKNEKMGGIGHKVTKITMRTGLITTTTLDKKIFKITIAGQSGERVVKIESKLIPIIGLRS